jgi:hypothetical protein
MNGRLMLQIILCGFLLLTTSSFTDSHAAESGEFKGAMIANGTRTPFSFGNDRQVFTFKLFGHVNLQTSLSKKKDYWAECVGLADSTTGLTGRCVWKDLDGPERQTAAGEHGCRYHCWRQRAPCRNQRRAVVQLVVGHHPDGVRRSFERDRPYKESDWQLPGTLNNEWLGNRNNSFHFSMVPRRHLCG